MRVSNVGPFLRSDIDIDNASRSWLGIGVASSDMESYEGFIQNWLLPSEIGMHTGCHRRNGPNFGRVFLMLNYTDITQNTYVPS